MGQKAIRRQLAGLPGTQRLAEGGVDQGQPERRAGPEVEQREDHQQEARQTQVGAHVPQEKRPAAPLQSPAEGQAAQGRQHRHPGRLLAEKHDADEAEEQRDVQREDRPVDRQRRPSGKAPPGGFTARGEVGEHGQGVLAHHMRKAQHDPAEADHDCRDGRGKAADIAPVEVADHPLGASFGRKRAVEPAKPGQSRRIGMLQPPGIARHLLQQQKVVRGTPAEPAAGRV
jgi:hypothetical protein